MKVIHCDRCGKECPAIQASRRETWSVPLNAGYPNVSVLAVFSVHISLEGHPGGFGGPPDLCEKCISEALRDTHGIMAWAMPEAK